MGHRSALMAARKRWNVPGRRIGRLLIAAAVAEGRRSPYRSKTQLDSGLPAFTGHKPPI